MRIRMLGGIGLTLAASGLAYLSWRRRFWRRLRARSRVAATARGPVEYAETGRGLPVLVVHGASGGFDQALLAAQAAALDGLRFIAPSRPGYLRTPLSVGESPAAQADAFAALLDALDIERTLVMAISAGGPVALHFAIRHPERCAGLVLLGAVTRRDSFVHRLQRYPYRLVLCEPLMNAVPALVARWPRRMPAILGVHDPILRTELIDDPQKFALFLDFLQCGRLMNQRKAGIHNDVAQIGALGELPLERIATPTLIVHGAADSLVSVAHARQAAARIAGARLLEIAEGEHLCFITHLETCLPDIQAFFAARLREPWPTMTNALQYLHPAGRS